VQVARLSSSWQTFKLRLHMGGLSKIQLQVDLKEGKAMLMANG